MKGPRTVGVRDGLLGGTGGLGPTCGDSGAWRSSGWTTFGSHVVTTPNDSFDQWCAELSFETVEYYVDIFSSLTRVPAEEFIFI